MNKHTKMAIFIAPFLIVGGYIAADYYAEDQAKTKTLFELSLNEHCNLLNSACTLSNKQLTLTLSHQNGVTQIESNHPLEEVTLSFVDKNNKEISYQMNGKKNKQHWQAITQASSLLRQTSELKIRLISIINGGYYYSEFYSRKR